MKSIPILTIEKVFEVSNGSCLLMPDFPIADNISAPISTKAMLVKQSKETKPCTLYLEVTHFNIPTSTDLNRRWRLTPRLSEINKTEIENGDVLHIFDAKLAEALAVPLN